MRALASVAALGSRDYVAFMQVLNALAQAWGLRVHTNWSKVWEYPWIWRQLAPMARPGARVLDIGSEISPLPWFLSGIGLSVTMLDVDPQWVERWAALRRGPAPYLHGALADSCSLPFRDGAFDIVTSASVIEHIPDKAGAIAEVARVLRRDGLFVLSFDICEPTLGMTFPDWNGRALTLAEFEELVWRSPEFRPVDPAAGWNLQDIEAFRAWHLRAAPHHNYVVGGAALRRA